MHQSCLLYVRSRLRPRSNLLRLSGQLSVRNIQQLSSPELRSRFLKYFQDKNHTIVKSASLIPHNDKSLLFTNAGMVPFKDYFRQPDTAPFGAATSAQKCMRAGGKHNDLDNVGYTPRHHTFFEMLGNFSFGQYGKEEAIRYAWRFLLDELKLPVDRLRVTILAGDQEGYELWKKQGLTDDMIVQCGPEDNFWSMGDGEGPCGPCTEIFWDTRDASLGEDRWLEIWNLVFMQNYRNAEGQLSELPKPCIDTGMGLERMAAVLQGKKNNFQIDQFRDLIAGVRECMDRRGLASLKTEDPSAHEKIIADHFRAMCFLICDGVVPSNIGRGYVLRRIIRRALRSARQLGINEPFLTDLYPSLLQGFVDGSYPELSVRASSICNIITNEESAFLATLDRGIALLDSVFEQPNLQQSKTIPAEIAFQLYDTYGFPFDLTLIIAKERGWNVDLKEWRNRNILPQFTGYDHALLHQESEVIAMDIVKKGKKLEVNVAIDPCPFYGLGGGQVPDQGNITLANGSQWNVTDVVQPYEGCLALRLTPQTAEGETIQERLQKDEAYFQVGKIVKTEVDLARRQGAEVHHTATHILNAGLRAVLNTDIVQAGSTVEPSKLRFDFTYGKPIKAEQLLELEDWVNKVALTGVYTSIKHMKLLEATSAGAIAAFSEKYGDVVRVIDVPGVGKELCGGTHVDNVRKLYPFKILSETSVAAGTRRIEAVAGLSSIQWYQKTFAPIPNVLKMLRANSTDEMVGKLEKIQQQTRDLQKRLDFMTEKLASAGEAIQHPIDAALQGVNVRLHLVDPELDANFMQKRANVLKESQSTAAHILLNGNTIVVSVPAKLTSQITANSILKHVLKHVKGGGGGQKEYAQGRLAKPILSVDDIEANLVPALEKA
ncbi:alanyl-tRNA synthetase [Radiomyces spectabilis]|uniref:alanyl-tRNA synthetase n=1 Tax=Radiomyces spectabilis TaxID=64574 RepID=UPI00222072F1|nr:alanyl-tRNA synthetase [Radiomyces spectabilis]KAI8384644.1 alanyl-tRNA synthetase [Radiomyces spectabilis]